MLKKFVNKEVSIQKNMIYNSIGNLIYGISQWALVAIVTTLRGFDSAGVLNLAVSIVAILYTLSLYGMRIFQATDVSNQYKDGDYTVSRMITIAISIPICILYIIYNRYDSEKCCIIIVFMLYKCVEAFSDVLHGLLQRKKRMDIIGISVAIRAVVLIISFFLTLILGYSLFIACVSLVVSSLSVLLLYDIPLTLLVCKLSLQFNLINQYKLLKVCFPLMMSGLINNAVLAIPKISLERFKSDEVLGIFSALSVPTLFVTSMAAYILAPIAVEFSECIQKSDTKKFMHIIRLSALWITVATIIAAISAFFFGDFGLKLVYGHDMSEYIPQFVILMLISGGYALITLMGNVFTTLRWLFFMFCMHLIVFIITYIISPILISEYGLWGAIITTAISSIIYLFINFIGIIFVRRKFQNAKA